jgi:hypothetical protein
MHRDDLKVLAPQWLNYTHIMRDDMEVRRKHRGERASGVPVLHAAISARSSACCNHHAMSRSGGI